MKKKNLVRAITLGLLLSGSVVINAFAANPCLAPDQSKVTNSSGIEIVNSYGTHINTKHKVIGYTVNERAANGARYVVAGVSNMGTYTQGGKILLYETATGSNVFKGEVKTISGAAYKYTATYDKETGEWNRYVEKPENGSISTGVVSLTPPKNLEVSTQMTKEENGYFKKDTITRTDSVTGKVSESTITAQTGDVVSASVNGDKLTITINGEKTEFIDHVGVNCDSRLEAVTYDCINGDMVFDVKDHVGTDESKQIKVSGIASKDDIRAVNDKITSEVTRLDGRVDKLDGRVDKVGAGAAALAALHPLDFDPDDKLTFSAGMGNYRGENAAAIGAFYRPDEKTMLSVGGTVGNGENMVNVGLSFALDRTNRVTNSRTAMAKEIVELRAQVAELSALVGKMAAQNGMTDEMKLFPDVAENHWAYEYVGKLAAAGIIEGYPDGNFSGDRMMSRYEFAAMLYRAMQNGAMLDSKIIKEFEPELGRIRVDRIHGEDSDRHKVERVRVNGQKGRDVYGSVLPVEK